MKKLFAVSVLLMMFGVCINAQDKNTEKALKGTWNYTSTDAPYEYQEGKVIFYEEEKEFKAKIDIQGYVIKAKDLKVGKDNAEFSVYVEGELVKVKLALKDGKMKGTAGTYDGDLAVNLVKE